MSSAAWAQEKLDALCARAQYQVSALTGATLEVRVAPTKGFRCLNMWSLGSEKLYALWAQCRSHPDYTFQCPRP